jgi:uncharacterized membrane protein YgdD (TMEM256/DUF423 family)
MRTFFAIGAFYLAAAIGAGALGAHALRATLDDAALRLWDTAARYLALGAVALLAVGLAAGVRPTVSWGPSGWALVAGTAIFAGTVCALALGGPRWLGAITPLGGALMILGAALAGIAALRS